MITGDLSHLRAPLLANIKPGHQVLVISDTAHDPRVWQVLMATAAELGADPTLVLFQPRPADYYDPPHAVAEAMQSVDVNVLVASTGMLHSEANNRAMLSGVPCICLDGGMRLEWFQSGAVTVQPERLLELMHHVYEHVFGPDATECRVTSRHGTDLRYSVHGRIFKPPQRSLAQDRNPYQFLRYHGLYLFLWPTGEFNVAPVEGSAEGRLVIDLTMHHLGRLRDPIALEIRAGRIVGIEGDADAHVLRHYLETYADENGWICPSEASIGINPNAVIRGNQREDKNILGSMHFGIGTNIDVGGSVRSRIHLDGVILEPTLEVDGHERIVDGGFVTPDRAAPLPSRGNLANDDSRRA